MRTKKMLAMVLVLVLAALSLAACGITDENGMNDTGKEPKNVKEAAAMYKDLMAQENAILEKNPELWSKVFAAADKGAATQEGNKDYADFLLKTIDSVKDKFTSDELALLQKDVEKIREVENKLTVLEEKYPDIAQESSSDGMSLTSDEGGAAKFPSFNGKDFDGNDVKSDELFAGNAVTVINFWFTTCGPCVSELAELDALNKELAEKGGTLVGINSFTLDGDKTKISEAKDVMMKKGASYRNIYFDSNSEAGKFIENIYAYPTTYVVDRNGRIEGEPIVGAITAESQMNKLKSLIDKVVAADAGREK